MQVSRQFADNFARVTTHYQLPPDELEEAKAAARGDMAAAEICFATLAGQIANALPDARKDPK